MHFPAVQWRPVGSTNPLASVNRAIGRRAAVAGIFPSQAASLRLLGAVIMEQKDVWAAAVRRSFSQESMTPLRSASPGALPGGTFSRRLATLGRVHGFGPPSASLAGCDWPVK